ncbi:MULTISPECIES: F0F1 ATP synthase subunit epsilon [Clostridium]|uniref:ATP synthase epsilon chain n=1 Tax=Clostridium senegalense TaxID=1465809 RepID=A0A6M0H649_9CLOT|nr:MULTISPECIES: F0F1 ATP synthase subunit epsilon [Clostridium]NEU06099.1 F0F1 ATP synthase subunit epsilon [Clostridium senegalense]
MENSFKLIIVTPDKELYNGNVVKLSSESSDGKFGILPNHMAMVSEVIPTIVNFQDVNGKEYKCFTSSGVIKVRKNEVTILCNAAEWPEDIDKKRAESAKKRAEDRLKNKNEIDVKRAELALKRSLLRLNL